MAASEQAFVRTFILAIVLLHITVAVFFGIAWKIGESHTYEIGAVEELRKRTMPVAVVNTAAVPAASPAPLSKAAPAGGDDVVGQVCSACHGSGVLGAPRIGDTADWRGRLARDGGIQGLVSIAMRGKGNMPPHGGRPDLNEEDIRGAVQAMLKKSGL